MSCSEGVAADLTCLGKGIILGSMASVWAPSVLFIVPLGVRCAKPSLRTEC